MTNISKNKITGADYKLAYAELIELLTKLQNNDAKYFLEELLTEAEKIMLVKRFAAIFMFQQNYLPDRVSQTISISLSTAQRLHHQYDDGHYHKLFGCLKPKDKNRFLALIEDLILAQASSKARSRLLKRVL